VSERTDIQDIDQNQEVNAKMMTLLEHLSELKDRVIRIAMAIFVWGIAAFFVAEKVLLLLLAPMSLLEEPISQLGIKDKALFLLLAPMSGYESEPMVQAVKPTATLGLFMKISIFTGAALAMPWIVHQVLIYVLPALTRREKRALIWIVPGATLLFFVGALFAFLIMVPAAVPWLLGFWAEHIKQNWMVDEYIPFVTGLVFWVGVAFETPLIMGFLARMEVVRAEQFLKAWKIAVVGSAVLAAFITPTPDPLNMSLVMIPLLVLYFAGILFARIAQPRRAKEDQTSEGDA
jgi:sec-independent protein translocase protein TatC